MHKIKPNLFKRKEKTVQAIIQELEKNNLAYVIARNYEDYPSFGHDLDLFYGDKISTFINIVKTVSATYGWDIVTHCEHWNKSRTLEHNIDVFCFYSFSINEYLQIDLFRAFLVWGTPLLNAEDIIQNKERHKSDLFFRPNKAVENIFRLLQIHKLMANKSATDKILRYCHRVTMYNKAEPSSIAFHGKKYGLFFLEESLDKLTKDNTIKFSHYITLSKIFFVLIRFIKSPIKIASQLTSRTIDYCRFYFISPCGRNIFLQAKNDIQKKRVIAALDIFVNNNMIPCWSVKKSGIFLAIAERKILERGGVIVHWIDEGSTTDILFNEHEDQDSIFKKLRDFIIFRHKVIYRTNE